MTTTDQFISQYTSLLDNAGLPTARLDVLVLLEDATGKDRAWLLAHPEFELEDKIETVLQLQIEKRANHTPLAYIRGKSEFYGREFIVTPDTLQPRSETETIIEMLHTLRDKGQETRDVRLQIVDVGTGSGCIAITAKLEFPTTKVYATDISADALEIAQQNAAILQADVQFLQGNLLHPLSSITYQISTIVLANLPYVPDTYPINDAAMFEPKSAIFGGDDGLDVYREMFQQISELSSQISAIPNYILAESLPFQHEQLAGIAHKHGYALLHTEDFIQVFRTIT